jgi:hypothetical protein
MLVLVGIATLIVIGYQSVQTARSARATQKSVELQVEAQRAQLLIRVKYPIEGLGLGLVPIVRLDVVNRGLTTAYECVHESWVEILPEPFVDFTTGAKYFKGPYPMTLYPNAPGPTVLSIGLERRLALEEINGLQAAKLFLCLRIRLEYRDAFNRAPADKKRCQNFGFMANGPASVGYLPKYNDSN